MRFEGALAAGCLAVVFYGRTRVEGSTRMRGLGMDAELQGLVKNTPFFRFSDFLWPMGESSSKRFCHRVLLGRGT